MSEDILPSNIRIIRQIVKGRVNKCYECYDDCSQQKVFVKVYDSHTTNGTLIQDTEYQNNIYLKNKGINVPQIYETYPCVTIMEYLNFIESDNESDLDLVIKSMVQIH